MTIAHFQAVGLGLNALNLLAKTVQQTAAPNVAVSVGLRFEPDGTLERRRNNLPQAEYQNEWLDERAKPPAVPASFEIRATQVQAPAGGWIENSTGFGVWVPLSFARMWTCGRGATTATVTGIIDFELRGIGEAIGPVRVTFDVRNSTGDA